MQDIHRDLARIREHIGLRDKTPVPDDPVEFAKACGLTPWTWQEELLTTNKKYIVLACGRQTGKSTAVAIAALRQALTVPGSLILVVARTLNQAGELTKKVYRFYDELDRPIPAKVDRQLSLELVNNSRVVTLPGTADNVRGYSDPAMVVIDEAAYISDDLYFALDPMLSSGTGKLYLLSTPNGKMGAFFETWERAQADPTWLAIRARASECPRISQEFLEERKELLPWWVYQQEHEAEFTEAEDSVFRLEDIMNAIDPTVKPLFPGGWNG